MRTCNTLETTGISSGPETRRHRFSPPHILQEIHNGWLWYGPDQMHFYKHGR